jgi:hypothetical protein
LLLKKKAKSRAGWKELILKEIKNGGNPVFELSIRFIVGSGLPLKIPYLFFEKNQFLKVFYFFVI